MTLVFEIISRGKRCWFYKSMPWLLKVWQHKQPLWCLSVRPFSMEDDLKHCQLLANIICDPWLCSGKTMLRVAICHDDTCITRNKKKCNLDMKELNITTVETLYNTIYYSKYFIELNFDKSTQYVALWTHKRHSIPRPFGRVMECLLWVLEQKLIVL